MDSILSVQGLSRVYVGASGQEVAVLKNVNFAIGAGQMIGIYGSSGSGKSSFLNCLGLLDSFYCDSMVVNGVDVTNANEGVKTIVRRENIGFIYQFHHLLRELTALENVILPLLISERPGGQNRTRAVNLLASLGLEDRLSHQPDQLSGGEQQRVAIARALSNNPKLIVADEPTGNLDSDNSHQVFRILKEVCVAQSIGIVVATHNMAMTSYMDRVYRIEDGGLIEFAASA